MNDNEVLFIKAHLTAIHHSSLLLLSDIDDVLQEKEGSYEQKVVLIKMSSLLEELKHSYCSAAKHVDKYVDGV